MDISLDYVRILGMLWIQGILWEMNNSFSPFQLCRKQQYIPHAINCYFFVLPSSCRTLKI